MIDVHTHVLPGADHGSASVKESLKMLEQLALDGVTDVFCTSHYYSAERKVESFLQAYDKAFATLQAAGVKGVRLHRGAEVTISRYFHYTRPDKALCLGGGNRILIELPFTKKCEEWVFDAIAALQGEYSLIPVIAHPERYEYVAKCPRILTKFCNAGAEIQVNAASFGARSAKRAIKFMLKNDLIDYVASDAHYGDTLHTSASVLRVLKKRGDRLRERLEKKADSLLKSL